MSKKEMGAFEFFDHVIAQDFGVPVEVYIETIENAPAFRAETILSGIINDDPKKREQARSCFHMLKPPNHRMN
ncbi:hypothetical protein [Salinimicrobium soli]|uniref:hypothetical protein n=1 Tax=Salinimicrobium soli TaxID=1254399 RepID=UPI003AAB7E65